MQVDTSHSIFQAPYPEQLRPKATPPGPIKKFKDIISLPKNLFCKAMNSLVNAVFVNTVILPAGGIFKSGLSGYTEHKNDYCNNPFNKTSSLTVKTADDVEIDGVITWYHEKDYENFKTKRTIPSDQKWVICFNGNTMAYEQILSNQRHYSNHTHCNIISFNYRGVGDSQGNAKSQEDLVLDGDALFQFLLAHGVKSEDILLDGLSVGGGISAQVRALHPEGPLANVHSFSSLSGVVKGFVQTIILSNYHFYHDRPGGFRLKPPQNEEHKRKLFQLARYKEGEYQRPSSLRKFAAKYISAIVGAIVSVVLKAASWDLDTLSQWDKIKGKKWIISANNDEFLHEDGMLYKALKRNLEGYKKYSDEEKASAEKKDLDLVGKDINKYSPELGKDTTTALKEAIDRREKVKKNLCNIARMKMNLSNIKEKTSHNSIDYATTNKHYANVCEALGIV